MKDKVKFFQKSCNTFRFQEYKDTERKNSRLQANDYERMIVMKLDKEKKSWKTWIKGDV